MTEGMIVPPTPYVRETLTQLLSDKYKMMSPDIRRKYDHLPDPYLQTRKLIGTIFEETAKAEGLVGEFYSDEYWTAPIWEQIYEIHQKLATAKEKLFSSGQTIIRIARQSLQSTQIKPKYGENFASCHQVRKDTVNTGYCKYCGHVLVAWLE